MNEVSRAAAVTRAVVDYAKAHAWCQALHRPLVARTLRHSAGRSVLLTFDDGPDPAVTPAVLDRLAAHRARAVFFVIGRHLRRAPALLAAIEAGGHLVGNHTHLHQAHHIVRGRRPLRFLEYYRDTRRCQTLIDGASRRPSRLFRQPGGRLTPSTLLVPRLLALRSVTWSREAQDWRLRTAEAARSAGDTLAAAARPGDILLLHDNHKYVLPLLDRLLPALVARGFDLRTGVEHV